MSKKIMFLLEPLIKLRLKLKKRKERVFDFTIFVCLLTKSQILYNNY